MYIVLIYDGGPLLRFTTRVSCSKICTFSMSWIDDIVYGMYIILNSPYIFNVEDILGDDTLC
jgi:hypothetical protein